MKRCPFCGFEAEVKIVTRHIENNRIVIKCTGCGASTRTFRESEKEKAVSAWEARTEENSNLRKRHETLR